MSSDRSHATHDQDNEPVNQAVHQLAMSLHEDIVSDLGRSTNEIPSGYEDRLALHKKNYPNLLFGELAMYLADVQLPPDASAPDRARGIVEALRRISQNPALFEAVTNAPYTQELANGIAPNLPKSVERDDREIAEVAKLQRKVAETGYLDQSMIPGKRVVQLQYATSTTIRPRRMSRSRVTEPAAITLKIVPANNFGWTIKQYKRWDSYTGFTGYTGNRQATETGTFNLIAVNSTSEVPTSLSKLVGSIVKIGQVSTGTQLKLDYNFTRPTQEVPGHEDRTSYETLALQAILQQAYLGDLTEYPLFP